MLQAIHRFWIEEMMFAFTSPLVLTAKFEFAMHSLVWANWMRNRMTCSNLCSNFTQPDAIQARDGSSKKLAHKFFSKTKGFKYLCTGVRSDRRHSHLRHHFENTFSCSLDVVIDCFFRIDPTKSVGSGPIIGGNHVFN